VFVPSGESGYLLTVEGATALEGDRLTLHQSVNGGMTWIVAGDLPADVNGGGIHTNDMLIGPDGYLYVSVRRNGPEREWVYRSAEPVVVANEPEAPELPGAEFHLSVQPNPLFRRAVVPFSVAEAARVQIVVFDMLGREVAVLADGRYEMGAYQVAFDGKDLPSGMYLVRANVAPENGGAASAFTQRLTLLK